MTRTDSVSPAPKKFTAWKLRMLFDHLGAAIIQARLAIGEETQGHDQDADLQADLLILQSIQRRVVQLIETNEA